MRLVGDIPKETTEEYIIQALKKRIKPFLEFKYYGHTIEHILFVNHVQKAAFLSKVKSKYSYGLRGVNKIVKLKVFNDYYCKECGSDFETYDFIEEGEDEFSMKITKLHQRCVHCGHLRTISMEQYKNYKNE